MDKFLLATVLLASTLVVAAGPSHAAEPQHLGNFKDWNAFTFEENGHKVCYMSSQPKKSDSGGKKRGDIYVLVTHRPAEKSLDVVSFIAGYAFKQGAEAALNIGEKKFKLFTEGDTAWARDEASDRAIINALKQGKNMEILGSSNRGTATKDTYSLSGAGQAYGAINEACGVKR